MDLSFTQEQTMLRDSLARYLSDNYSYEAWRKFTRSETGRDAEHWKQFAELGLLAAPLPEEHGGFGGGPVDVMVIMEEFGKALVIEPYVPTVVIGGTLLQGADDALKQDMLAKIAAGETLMAFAFAEAQGRYNLADLTTTAKKQGSDYVLSGRKAAVIGAPFADTLIVTARTGGARREEKGVGIFLVDKSAAGVSRRDYRTIDGNRASEITLENVPARVIAEDAMPLLQRAVNAAIAAHAAEAVGAMGRLVTATVEYSKTRKQFGQPIGKFQVLQHRMVDMFTAHELAQSASLMATLKLDDPYALAAAKAAIGKYGKQVGESAVQTHGGMGMTDELSVGHYFKRLAVLEILYGSTDHHLRQMAGLLAG